MNVRGCGGSQYLKRKEIEQLFGERKLDILALSETKVKGKGEEWFGAVKGVKSGVSEGRGREGVCILMRDDMWECVVECKEVNSRCMWVRMKMGREKWVVVAVYGPGSEHDEEVRVAFWEELNECLSEFGVEERVIVLGDMNAKVGNVAIDGVIGPWGVDEINLNGRLMIDVCIERELVIGNTWFNKRDIHKYTWESTRGNKSLIDFILIEESVKQRLLDVKVLKYAGAGIGSDHYLVEGVVKMGEGFGRGGRVSVRKEVVKVSELGREECEREYRVGLGERWRVQRVEEEGSVEEEWSAFKDAVYGCAKEVCGVRLLGGNRVKRGCNWWNDEAKRLVKWKKAVFEKFLRGRDRNDLLAYKEVRNLVKRRIREIQREENERWGERVSMKYKENKKMFWKEINDIKKGRIHLSGNIKDRNGSMLTGKKEVEDRWKEYFEDLLNVRMGNECNITALGRHGIGSERVDVDEDISDEEVRVAIGRMKSGKSAGLDGVCVEMLKKGGEVIVEWMVRLFRICMSKGEVPDDWKRACIVPLYKGKGEKSECKNYRGISLLSVPGKVYGRVLIERVGKRTDGQLGEEQCGFRRGRGCVDQIFTVKNVCEKYLEKGKELYVAFMDLEKAYDRIDREALWKVLQIYGVGGKLLNAVKSFYAGSRACVRVGREEGGWFSVDVGLRQGCVMSPGLFNVYMDGLLRELKTRVLERGAEMIGEGDEVWNLVMLLFADDAALLADTLEKLRRLVEEYGNVCERRGLCVNVGKSKVMRCNREGLHGGMEVYLNGEKLEEVECFRYLGADVAVDGRMTTEVNHRVGEGLKVFGALKSVWKERSVGMKAKMGMYEGVVVPSMLYACETWGLSEQERKRVEVADMRCLRAMCGLRLMDRVRNTEIRERCGDRKSVLERADEGVLKWFGHLERMNEDRLVKKVYTSEVGGTRGVGRPRFRWKDGVKKVLHNRGLGVQEAKRRAVDRVEWANFMYS